MTENYNNDCSGSPWIDRARRFIEEHSNNIDYLAHIETLQLLLRNHRGINNTISENEIVEHLRDRGIQIDNREINRENFQQRVLVELKREGIVGTLIYPGPRGGVFIPCNEEEVRQVARQVLTRIRQEVTNLSGLVRETNLEQEIRNLLDCLRNNITL